MEWWIHYGEGEAIAAQMNMNNVRVREIGFLLGISHWLELKWIKAAYRDMKEWLNREGRIARDITGEIELDEI